MDPHESGRHQLRIYGRHDDEKNVKDEDLPWGTPLQPITSAATGKIGTSPTGMLVGSRVFGFYADDAMQYPIIMGSYARAAKPKDPMNNTGGESDSDSKGNDVPGHRSSNSTNWVNPQQKIAGSNSNNIDITKIQKYNEAPHQDDTTGDELTKSSKKTYAEENGDKPTIGSIDKKNSSKVLEKITKVDPQSNSSVLPKAVDNFKKIMSISNATSGGSGLNKLVGGGLGQVFQKISGQNGLPNIVSQLGSMLGVSGSGNGSGSGGNSSPQVTQQHTVDTLANMLNQLAGHTTPNAMIASIDPISQETLYFALLELLNSVNGDLTINQKPAYPTGAPVEIQPQFLVNDIPDGYIEIFSYSDVDPYPSYILWEGPSGDFLFTKRPDSMPYAPNPEYSVIEEVIVVIINDLVAMAKQGKFNLDVLLQLLASALSRAQEKGNQNALGKNVNQSNIGKFAQQLLGTLGSLINESQSDHISKSVLDVEKMKKALDNYTNKGAILRKKKKLAQEAVKQKTPLSFSGGLMKSGGMNGGGDSGASAAPTNPSIQSTSSGFFTYNVSPISNNNLKNMVQNV